MKVNLTIKEAEVLLAALDSPSVTDEQVAALYERIERMLDAAKLKRNRSNNDAKTET